MDESNIRFEKSVTLHLTEEDSVRISRNRRKFLKLAAGSAAVLAVGGAAYYYGSKNQSKSVTKNQSILATQNIGDVTSSSTFIPARAFLFPIIADQDCIVTAVGVHSPGSDGSGYHIQVGIYADCSGVPGALLGYSDSVDLVSGVAWYDCHLTSPVSFVGGSKYWIAFKTDDTLGGFRAYYSEVSSGTHYDESVGTFGVWPDLMTIIGPFANVTINMRITFIPTGSPAYQSIGAPSWHAGFGGGIIYLSPITLDQTCTITKVGLNIQNFDAGSHLQTAIYSDSGGTPGSLLGYSNSVALAKGWLDCPLISSVDGINATKYWIAWNTDNPAPSHSTSGLTSYSQIPGGSPTRSKTASFNTWPNSLTSPGTTGQFFNMRVTYTTPAGSSRST